MYARELLKFNGFELNQILTGSFPITFDDNVTLVSTSREAIYSSYFWEFHRQYPNTPLLSSHHVSSVLNNKPLTSNTHILLLQKIYWDTVMVYSTWSKESVLRNIDAELKDKMIKLIYEVTNNLYNDVSYMSEDSVLSIDILDFIEISRHSKVLEAFDNITHNSESINNTYNIIMDVINNDSSLKIGRASCRERV
jgi:hypothetical protein